VLKSKQSQVTQQKQNRTFILQKRHHQATLLEADWLLKHGDEGSATPPAASTKQLAGQRASIMTS
jgi:hypothetical protein